MITGCLCRYYNDLWVYNMEELSWRSVGRAGSNGPSPRGGCQLAVHADRCSLTLLLILILFLLILLDPLEG